MKRISIVILILVAALASCKKDNDTVFDKSPDERIKEKLDEYQAQLLGSQYGWNGTIITNNGTGPIHTFYFKFADANRVTMLSGFDSLSAVEFKESSYRLKALQQPSLLFDTYSYLHVLSDPDDAVNGGIRGGGLLSDFEFYFESATADSIKLVGRVNSSKLTLVKATQADQAAYNSGQLAAGLNVNKILTYFKRLTIGSQLYDVKIDPISRLFVFSWLDGSGNLQTFSTSYYLVNGGVVFTTPLVNGSQTIDRFTNLVWDATTETVTLVTNNTVSTIKGIVVPLKVDVAAPKRWWDYAVNNGNSFWISQRGFHVNGVDDAFGIQTLPRYFFLAYWPEYDPGNDLFAPIFLNAAGTSLELQYGTAPDTPTFTTDGRAIFVQLGNYGPYPNTGPAGQSRALLYNASGYYFVQTGEATYDMVSASNGKSWISWEF